MRATSSIAIGLPAALLSLAAGGCAFVPLHRADLEIHAVDATTGRPIEGVIVQLSNATRLPDKLKDKGVDGVQWASTDVDGVARLDLWLGEPSNFPGVHASGIGLSFCTSTFREQPEVSSDIDPDGKKFFQLEYSFERKPAPILIVDPGFQGWLIAHFGGAGPFPAHDSTWRPTSYCDVHHGDGLVLLDPLPRVDGEALVPSHSKVGDRTGPNPPTSYLPNGNAATSSDVRAVWGPFQDIDRSTGKGWMAWYIGTRGQYVAADCDAAGRKLTDDQRKAIVADMMRKRIAKRTVAP